MVDNSSTSLDVDQILQSKAGNKAKYIPRFVVNYLKKILHQDELNIYLQTTVGKVGVPFLKDSVEFLDMTLKVNGLENLSEKNEKKWYTFVSNHPLGGQDGVALGYILGTRYEGKIKYLVNDLLMNLKELAPLFIPINKTGSQSKDFPRMVEAAFASDNHILMFPAGLCSRRQNGIIKDLPWKKTFITKSVEHQRDVVPIHFEGRNSNFFYNLATICKLFGLKFNLAMVYLVDEMFKNKHKTFNISIGKPIPWQTFDKSRTPAQWAEYVKEIVYEL